MNNLTSFLFSPLAEAMGWTVFHSLWQGFFIALLLKIGLSFWSYKKATIKYWLSYGALVLQFILAIVTFSYLYSPKVMLAETMDTSPIASANGSVISSSTLVWWEIWQDALTPFLPIIACLWLAGMAFFFIRLATSWWYWQKVKNKYAVEAPTKWVNILNKLRKQFQFRVNIDLKLSPYISSPLLLGQIKPVILFPVALVNQLTTAQVEAIIAHELAHLSRFDYFLNWIQLIIESVFYYHPATWWIGTQIRELREHCCDDKAVDFTGNSLLYAKTLMEMAERRTEFSSSKLALAFSQQPKKSLLTRIQRILKQPSKQPDMREKFFVTGSLLVFALAVSLGAGWPTGDILNTDTVESFETIVLDTFPAGNIHLTVNENGEEIEVKLEEGNITKLLIDGEEIPAAEYPEHEEKIQTIFDESVARRAEHHERRSIHDNQRERHNREREIRVRKRGSSDDRRIIIDSDEENNIIIRRLGEDGSVEIEELQGLPAGTHGRIRVVIDSIGDEVVKTVNVDFEEFDIDLDDHETIFYSEDGEINLEDILEEEVIFIMQKDMDEEDVWKWVADGDEISIDEENNIFIIESDGDEEDHIFIIRDGEEESRVIEWEEERVIRRELEERREVMEERHAEMEERRAEMEERHAEMIERQANIEYEIRTGNDDSWLEHQLLRDGLIDDPENYKLELSGNRMKVNGKRMSEDVLNRYKEMYEGQTGTEIHDGTKISVTKRN